MSTRCNVRISDHKGHTLWLYRHHDGYPAATGADLAKHLKRYTENAKPWRLRAEWSTLCNQLVRQTYDRQPWETEAKQVYEITEDMHDDIEWFYAIEIKACGYITIEAGAFRPGDTREPGAGLFSFYGGIAEFRDYCAVAVQAMRQRNKQHA